MSKLAIYKHGELFQTLDLKVGEEYLVGRGADCDVVLDGVTGISRQHFKVYHDGQDWQVESLSKFGSLLHKGGTVHQVTLVSGESFSIKPFEFSYSEEKKKKHSVPAVINQDYPPPPPTDGFQNSSIDESSQMELTQKTSVTQSADKPYIVIHNTISKENETLRLEGNVWVAGRDAGCEIILKDRGSSRHHFELSQAGDGFYIRDLNSANGTSVNGSKILPDQPVPIKSGDTISVLSLEIKFEVRDPKFGQKLGLVPSAMMEPMAPAMGWGDQYPMAANGHGAYPAPAGGDEENTGKKKFNWKKHRIRIAAGVILLLALWIGLSDPPKKNINRDPSNVPDIFANLPKEQRDIINNSYNVAKELIIKKECGLALPELRRIHELVPFYKDSKQIEVDCQQQIETIKLYEELQQRKAQEAETLRRVEAAVARCDSQMNESTTIDELAECLGDEGSLIPEHEGVQRLRSLIEERELEKQRKFAARQEYEKKVARGIRLYNAAATLEEKGQDYDAIKSYEKFLASSMPDPDGLRTKAKRSIASLKETMASKIDAIIEQAIVYFDQTQFNKGMALLHRGLKIDPTSEKLEKARKKFEHRNDREMKIIYSDSVLEESLGNIESAKDRWRKILELSYSGSGYYKKAKLKLKKYGEQ